MASAAATSALGTEVLAVQRLFYNVTPNPVASVFLLFSSQLLGYGLGGLFRGATPPVHIVKLSSHARHITFSGSLLYPSKMLYPAAVPLVSMFDTLYRDHHKGANRKKFKVFWIVFGV